MQVEEGMTVCVDGKPVTPAAQKTYLKLYKPVGVVCTSDRREKDNVIDYIRYPVRVTYVGRLDRNSEGLLLLTDDGDLIEALMRSRNAHENRDAPDTPAAQCRRWPHSGRRSVQNS